MKKFLPLIFGSALLLLADCRASAFPPQVETSRSEKIFTLTSSTTDFLFESQRWTTSPEIKQPHDLFTKPVEWHFDRPGYQPNKIWYKYRIQDNSEEPYFFFTMTSSFLENVQITLFDSAGREIGNLSRSFVDDFSSRSLFRPSPTFRLTLPKNTPLDVIVSLQSLYPLNTHLRVAGSVAFNQSNSLELIFSGFFIGILFCIVLYNSLLFAFTKERMYLDFALFSLCFSLYSFFANGLSVFIPALREDTIPLIMMALTVMSFCRFAISSFAQTPPWTLKLIFRTINVLGFISCALVIMKAADLILLGQIVEFLKLTSLTAFAIASLLPGHRQKLAGVLTVTAAIVLSCRWLLTLDVVLGWTENAFLALHISEILMMLGVLVMASMVALQVRTSHFARIAAEAKAENNDRLKQFIQILCHDLANPLTRIIALLERTNSRAPTEDSKKLLKAAYHQKAIIEHVRHKQFDRSIEHLSVQPVLVKDALQDSQFILTNQLIQKDLHLDIQIFPPDLMAKADPIILKHTIISNVLSNAIKFSHSSSTIKFSATAFDSEWIKISIEDFGVGIPISQRTKLFETEDKLSRPGTDGETGSGIGLGLVKAMLDALGGRIEVESHVQGETSAPSGTVVHIWLPKAEAFPSYKVIN